MASEEQQFCLRWNNFQASITSQFETLRDDEAFTDVTIACEGQQVQAHKIILSACSPFLKDLLKSNPCSHPIIFMRDVEAQHVIALMEFMYAGEVNVAQAQLPAFLKTAEALKIRGLTDTSSSVATSDYKDAGHTNKKSSPPISKQRLNKREISSCSSIVTSSQDIDPLRSITPPPIKRCKTDANDTPAVDRFLLANNSELQIEPKRESVDYFSDEDGVEEGSSNFNNSVGDVTELVGGMEIIPQTLFVNNREGTSDPFQGLEKSIRRSSVEDFAPFPCNSDYHEEELTFDIPNLVRKSRRKTDGQHSQMIILGDGIEINENQLRSVKWSDYKKLTRGLATLLFSPEELATCSVTGQRWSRAGDGERPVKPALNRAKVQAIITYVANRFPTIEISRIKQVLAYKCKENSTALKMKAVRYFGDHLKPPDN